jgi:hypothetical protein
MSGTVFQRAVFVEVDKSGFFRFTGWAMTTTSLGAMAEPFFPRQAIGPEERGVTFDAADDVSLISDILQVNADLVPTLLSGGGAVWAGGVQMPRVGR